MNLSKTLVYDQCVLLKEILDTAATGLKGFHFLYLFLYSYMEFLVRKATQSDFPCQKAPLVGHILAVEQHVCIVDLIVACILCMFLDTTRLHA